MDDVEPNPSWILREIIYRILLGQNSNKLLFYIKIRKKIAKISARNRNVDWLQVKIAEIKKDKKKLERKK